jgi:hypothetical protein
MNVLSRLGYQIQIGIYDLQLEVQVTVGTSITAFIFREKFVNN